MTHQKLSKTFHDSLIKKQSILQAMQKPLHHTFLTTLLQYNKVPSIKEY